MCVFISRFLLYCLLYCVLYCLKNRTDLCIVSLMTQHPTPYYVQDNTTWMTFDSAEIKESHSIMEELYRPNSSMKCQTPAQSEGLSEFNTRLIG